MLTSQAPKSQWLRISRAREPRRQIRLPVVAFVGNVYQIYHSTITGCVAEGRVAGGLQMFRAVTLLSLLSYVIIRFLRMLCHGTSVYVLAVNSN